MTGRVSVVVVNFNSGACLATCLASVADTLEGTPWNAVVVDNASTDGGERAAGEFGSRVLLRRNLRNLGFAAAANQGIAATAADHILFLNPDCRVLPEAVARLATEIEGDPRCALVGPRVLDEGGAVQGSARGDPTMLTGLFGRSTWLTRVFPKTRLARRNIRTTDAIASAASSIEVDWVSGACMLARRAAVQAVGGFDESYFLYWEDADLCRRLRAAGHTIRYVPGAQVVHLGGQSKPAAWAVAIRAFHRSAYTYYTTHVVTRRWHPARWLAWTILQVRCHWKLLGKLVLARNR